MKKTLLVAGGLVVLLAGGVAVAQAPSPPSGGPEMQGPGPGMHGPEMRGPGMGGPGMMRGRWGMRHRMDSKAAKFMFRKGDSVVAIKCADDEPMKACVDASSALIDKMASLQK